MNQFLLLGIVCIGLLLILGLFILKPFRKFNGLKVLSIFLFLAYCSTLGYGGIKGGYDFKIDYNYMYSENPLFDPAMTVFIVLLRTLTTVMVVVAVMEPFYKNNYFKRICQFVLPIVSILNIVFLDNNIVAMFGKNVDYTINPRGYAFIFTLGGLLAASICHVVKLILNKEYKITFEWKTFSIKFLKGFLLLLVLCLALMQQGALYTIFGTHKFKTKDFSDIHKVYLAITLLSIIVPGIVVRKYSLEDRKLFFGVAALAGFVQYFYENRAGLSGLPLHLCNTAVVMMFIAYVFKFKGVFYFSYFVNVLGALFAIVMPNTELHANHVRTLHFWYNHIYAFALPILGVGLGVYERPNLKVMLRAIGFFTIYFMTTVVLNAWFNSAEFKDIRYGTVDYFFTYSDFFVEKIEAVRPIYDMTWIVQVGEYSWRFMPLYQFLIYVVFIALMFVIWLVYDYLYQVSDRHAHLLAVKLKQRQEHQELKKLSHVGNEVEPLHKDYINMIKISHFTKQYWDADTPSVKDFSLEIHGGEVFGFIGHNGSGKSTTIKSIVGIQSLTEGFISINGYDITKQTIEAKSRIGYVSDNHAVYEMLTGREYINYVADLYFVSKEDRDERIAKYTKMFNLTDAIDDEIKSYSHGMKQKLVVIASLIHNPKVWILDEPLTGLDPTSAFQIKECMRDHANNGNIVFFSSHVIEVVEKICDRICIIQKGNLVGTYVLNELGNQGITLEELFLKHVKQNDDDETSLEVSNN